MIELLLNEVSEDNLIPEFNSSKLSDSERPESPEIALIGDVADEATPEASPIDCPSFTANAGLNTNI
jgi:hypothetical protein